LLRYPLYATAEGLSIYERSWPIIRMTVKEELWM
jgi:hypothetical protein